MPPKTIKVTYTPGQLKSIEGWRSMMEQWDQETAEHIKTIKSEKYRHLAEKKRYAMNRSLKLLDEIKDFKQKEELFYETSTAHAALETYIQQNATR